MKKLLLAATAAASLVATPALAGKGNGAPTGSHYNLNIIGVPKHGGPDNSGGHVIFVSLDGHTKIMLTEGDDFAVLDKDGTDGTAEFQLPNPDADNTGSTTYSVFARALGKPNGSATMTTCAYDPVADEEVCSMQSLTLTASKGPTKFRNVSKELLYIYADITDDNIDNPTRFPLFDTDLQDYFWDYDNNGLRLAQLRFYPCSTDVPDGDGSGPINDAACFN